MVHPRGCNARLASPKASILARTDLIQRRRTQIRLAQRAYRQRKETTISGLNGRVASLEKTIEDMHKTFLEFNDRAIAAGIQKGAPALAGQLRSTAERLNELAKNSTEDSEGEEDENDTVRSVRPVATEPRSRRQGGGSGPEAVSMLGYQATFGEEEDEEEDAGEIAAPPAPCELDNRLPLSKWTGTEGMQQLRSEGPKSNMRRLHNIKPMPYQQKWVDVLDSSIEQFLRSKGLYLDGRYSVPFDAVTPPLGSEATRSPAVSSLCCSPSLISSGGPHTPESIDGHWPKEGYSSGTKTLWSGTRSVCKSSDRDMEESFDDTSIRL